MRANDWILSRERAALRRGAFLAFLPSAIVGLLVMLAIHITLSMHATAIHERAQATIREADALLGGNGVLVADVQECRELVELVSEEKYEIVRDYHRQIDELQAKNQQGRD